MGVHRLTGNVGDEIANRGLTQVDALVIDEHIRFAQYLKAFRIFGLQVGLHCGHLLCQDCVAGRLRVDGDQPAIHPHQFAILESGGDMADIRQILEGGNIVGLASFDLLEWLLKMAMGAQDQVDARHGLGHSEVFCFRLMA